MREQSSYLKKILLLLSVVFAFFVLPVVANTMQEYLDTDYVGNNYNGVPVTTTEQCRDVCLADPKCLVATFRAQEFQTTMCWLKDKPASDPSYAIITPAGSISVTLNSYVKMYPTSFDSSPPGARVSVDWEYKGSTPFSINLVGGSHIIRIVKDGYSPYTTEILVGQGQLNSVYGVLSPTTGSITFYSFPGGASLYVDGIFKGTTPLDVSDLTLGSHTYRLEKQGYQTETSTFLVTAGSNTPLSITLTETQVTGSISVSSTPSGASISLDGANKGTTPTTLTGVAAGSHSLLLTKTGYNDYTTTIAVTVGQTTIVSATLVPLQSTGSISVSSFPANANVFVDGIMKGITPLTISNVPTGSHTVRLTMNEYEDDSRVVTVSSGQILELSISLQRTSITHPTTTIPLPTTTTYHLPTINPTSTITQNPPTGIGSLEITTNPQGAHVYIDGELKGVSPTKIPGLSAGTHNLILKMEGYEDLMTTVTITAGQTQEYSTSLLKGSKTPGFEAIGTGLALFLFILFQMRRK